MMVYGRMDNVTDQVVQSMDPDVSIVIIRYPERSYWQQRVRGQHQKHTHVSDPARRCSGV